MSNGKGDKPRPLSVPREVYEERFESIFKVHDDDFSNLEYLNAQKKPIKYKCHSCGDYVSEKGCDQPNCTIKE